MRMQSPSLVVSSSRSLLTNTIKLRNKPVRLLALLALIAVAATALTAKSSSAQVLFGKASLMLGLGSTPASSAMKAAPLNPALMSPNAPLPPSDTMLVERRGHTATRLSNGTVLIAGGENSSGALNECEIYDPSSATFSVIGNMGTARADHSATLLADGRVLIAGGHDAAGALNTTEIFDPTTGAFASGPAMSVARAGHSATLFADGRVFVAGGDANGSAEIFDPSTGTFSATGANMNVARSMHSAALLADGRVLLVGGRNASGDALASGEIFDTPAASFSTVDSALKVARAGAHLRVLFDGKVQIIGGSNDGSMEIYDPLYGAFGAYAHVIPESDTCAGLPGQVLASQTRAALFHNGQTDPLFDRNGQTITEMSGQALVLGGANSAGTVLSSSSVVASSSAAITTDKMDYIPGETVTITGRGFQAGEIVRFKIHEDPHTPQERGFDTAADSNGNINGEYLVQDYDLDMKFVLGARGLTSGVTAQTTFTDNKNFTINFAGTGGGSIAFSAVTGSPSPSTNPCIGTPNPCINALNNNATGTLTVTPNVGSVFVGWSGTWDTSQGGSTTCTGTTSPCSFSMGSGPGAPQVLTATFSGNVATTTTVTSSVNPSTFGQSVLFTATVSRLSGSPSPTGTVQFKIDGVNLGIPVTLSSVNAISSSATSIATTTMAVGTRVITGEYTSGAGFSASSGTLSGGQVVNKADQTITFGALADKTYGDADFGVGATASSGLAVSFSSQTLSTCTVSGSTVHIVAAGPCTIRASQAGDGSYNAAPDVDQSFTVNPKTLTASIIGNPTKPYDGNTNATLTSANFSLSGLVDSDSFTVTKTTGTYDSANVATATTVTTSLVAGDFNPGGGTSASNYNLPTTASGAGQITKADATVVVTPYNVTYDGNPHSATYTITGVNGETGATVGTVDVSNTTHTNAGTYSSDSWSFTGTANYNNVAATTITDIINKADATFTVTPYNVTYDGLSHTAAVSTITGVNGETGATVGTVDVSNTTHTNAGTYSSDTWSFTGTANYNNIASTTITDTINQALVTATAGNGSSVYDGVTHSPSACVVTGAYIGGLSCVNNPASVGPNIGTTTINPVTSGADLANFIVTDVNGSYTINPALVTATAGSGSNLYDGATHSPSACVVSGAYTGGLSCVNNPASVGPNIGTTTINPVTSGADLANFIVTDVNGSYTISPAPVTATAGGGLSVYDGVTHSPSACAVTGAYTGDLTCANNPASVGPNIGTTPINADVSGTGLTNYSITYVVGSYTISPAPVTATAGGGLSVYDGVTHSPAACVVTGTYIGSLSCVNSPAAVGPGVGTTVISPVTSGAGLANFVVTDVNGSYTIDPALVTATAGSGSNVYDGATHSPSACVVTGAFIGGLSCVNNPASVGPNIGTTIISPVTSGTDLANFIVNGVNGSYTISQALVMATAGSGSETYNGLAQSPSACVVSGAYTGGLSCVNNPSSVGPNIGTTPISAVTSGADLANFIVTDVAGSYTIDPALVTATAGGGSSVYDGATHSPSACAVTGAYIGGLSCVNDPASVGPNIGTTPISPVTSGTDLANFTVTPVNGSYTIDQRAATWTTNPNSKTYGNADPFGVTTGSGSNFVAADNVTATYSRVAGESASLPTYHITATLSATGDLNNYIITNAGAEFTINKRPLTITANDRVKTYGDSLALGTTAFTKSGEAPGEAVTSVTLTSTSGLAGSVTTSAGVYPGNIVPSAPTGTGGFLAGNYNITFNNGKLTVDQRPATVTANNKSKIYGVVNPALDATVTGTVNSDTLNYTLATTATQFSVVGNYPITVTLGLNPNYSVTKTDGTLTITTGYCFTGFLSPISGSVETLNGGSFTDPLRAFKLGSTIPVKFAIASWNGTACGAPVITGIHTLQAAKYTNATDSDPALDATPTDAATTGNQFRLTDSQWHFNLSTKGGGFTQGTWLLTATLQDGSIHTVWISIKK